MDDKVVWRGKQAYEALGGWKIIGLFILLVTINVLCAIGLITQ